MNNKHTDEQIIAEYIRSTEFKLRMADRDIRQNPTVQHTMRSLIDDLGNLILDHATELTEGEGGSLFDRDQHADNLVWLLAEFLGRAQIDREDCDIARAYQLTEDHAGDFFG